MNVQMDAHLQATGLFRTGAQQAQDPEVKTYAAQLLPSIVEHYEMASTMSSDRLSQGNQQSQ